MTCTVHLLKKTKFEKANYLRISSIIINCIFDFFFFFFRKYNFDGLDLDWLSPTSSDKTAYTSLVSELKAALSKENLILTVTIPVDEASLKNGYDLNKISQNADLIHIMTYNYHSIYDGTVGANAPIKNIVRNNHQLFIFNFVQREWCGVGSW